VAQAAIPVVVAVVVDIMAAAVEEAETDFSMAVRAAAEVVRRSFPLQVRLRIRARSPE